jgi:S1-C subfamily serine protease
MALLAIFVAIAGYGAPLSAQPSVGDVLGAIVRVQSEIDPAARTANSLGLKREGHGVVIDSNGLVLTVGYLILEAVSITVTGPGGASQPARVIAYDHNTGFGLLRTARPLPVTPMRLGDSRALAVGDDIVVVATGGVKNAIRATVVARRDFAGYWEYLLPNAIFTQPLFRDSTGVALIDTDGRLVGIGSLIVRDALERGRLNPANMFLPIEALKPILGDLIANGRSAGPRRPWIGVYTREHANRLIVTRLAVEGPGAAGGVMLGDTIVAVGGKPVRGQIDFYRSLWALGAPGVAVGLIVRRQDGEFAALTLTSRDRHDWLRLGAPP